MAEKRLQVLYGHLKSQQAPIPTFNPTAHTGTTLV